MNRIYIILFVLACCQLMGLSANAQQVTVQEGAWEAVSECVDCAQCGEALSGKKERSKKLAFYNGNQLIGEWYVLEMELVDCNQTEYRTLSPRGMAVGPTVFQDLSMTLLDVAQELRKAVPEMADLSAMGVGDQLCTAYLLEHWQDPLPNNDPKVVDRNE